MRVSTSPLWLGCALARTALAVDIDWTSSDSIKAGAADVAWGLMKYYTGNNTGDTPGNLPDPYYWWEAGAFFGLFVDYWSYTGDTSYVNVTFQAMQHQAGDSGDFMPVNQTRTEGNDDQGFWAMAAMTAAEKGFQNPDNGTGTQWLTSVQAVFNEYVSRWDTADCGGGLRWQIWSFNNGYTYKNSISNGCFFNIAARLARYTGNSTYADWANTLYDWMEQVQFIENGTYNVYDGSGFSSTVQCTDVSKVQYTYNAGIWLHGAAMMYNYTNGSSTWETRVAGMVNRTGEYFFNNSVMYEPSCEPASACTTDSLSFKAYLVNWLAETTQVAAFTYDTIDPLLTATAKGAALQCSGTADSSAGYKGHTGTACGYHWVNGATWDGTNGVGQQMGGLAAIFYSQVRNWGVAAPLSSNTGGTSQGNPAAGTGSSATSSLTTTKPITTGDRVGAGFLTTLVLAGLLGGCAFMVKD